MIYANNNLAITNHSVMSKPTFQVASDLHLEFIDEDAATFDFDSILTPSSDILALPGDIGGPFASTCPLFQPFLAWCSANWKYVLFVPGNHCYYTNKGLCIDDVDAILAHICETFHNVYYLNNRVMDIMGERFIGTTLRSYVPDSVANDVADIINDYRLIYQAPGQLLTIQHNNALFKKNEEFLLAAILDAASIGIHPVVITHNTPVRKGTSHPRFNNSVSNYAFSTDILCPPDIVKLWCCGHTHYNFDFQTPSFRLISNQMGYSPDIEPGYVKDWCIPL